MLNRSQPLLIAGLLPLLVFAWFVPKVAGQIDFWLLWLVAMVLVGLPLIFAEIALAHRSGVTPLVGLPKLTREADISTAWRGFGWLATALLLVLSAHLIASAVALFAPWVASMAIPALLGVLALVVIGLSFTKQISGWLALALGLGALLFNLTLTKTVAWQMTDISLSEWALATVLALVSVGAGTGLYWQARANQLLLNNMDSKTSKNLIASRAVLPVWVCQVVGGGVVALLSAPLIAEAGMVYAVACVAGAAYIVSLLTQQLSLFFGKSGFNFLVLVVAVLAATALAWLPTAWLNQLLMLLSFISALWLAVLAGWQMKISHVRKSMNFSSEGVYNLWRIAVRVLVPLAIVIAIVGWAMSF